MRTLGSLLADWSSIFAETSDLLRHPVFYNSSQRTLKEQDPILFSELHTHLHMGSHLYLYIQKDPQHQNLNTHVLINMVTHECIVVMRGKSCKTESIGNQVQRFCRFLRACLTFSAVLCESTCKVLLSR